MSAYTVQRAKAVEALASDYGVSAIYAGELARAWEYEANRRNVDQRAVNFWDLGRAWISEELIRRKGEAAEA